MLAGYYPDRKSLILNIPRRSTTRIIGLLQNVNQLSYALEVQMLFDAFIILRALRRLYHIQS